MPEEFKAGCKKPKIEKPQASVPEAGEEGSENQLPAKEERQSMIKVGKPAPDFTTSGYYQGNFVSVSLSEYLGKWVFLCFYPGDFTFV